MSKQIQLFPPEIIENTTEAYLPNVEVRNQIIYILALLMVVGALLSTPFVFVDVSVQSNGIIRTVAEKNEVRSLVSGLISSVQVKENTPVRMGQTLFILKTDVLDTKIRLSNYHQQEKNRFIQDLFILVKIDSASLFKVNGLGSSLYIQQYSQFKYALQENFQRQRKVKKELDTDRFLYKEKVIAMREFDEKEFAYNQLVAENRSTIER